MYVITELVRSHLIEDCIGHVYGPYENYTIAKEALSNLKNARSHFYTKNLKWFIIAQTTPVKFRLTTKFGNKNGNLIDYYYEITELDIVE